MNIRNIFQTNYLDKLKMNSESSSRKRKKPSYLEDFYDSSLVEKAAPTKKVSSRLCVILVRLSLN